MAVKVSILVPAFNAGNFLPELLNSLAEQTFKDYELVLVNDASTDNTLQIMKNAEQNYPTIPKIKVITYPINKTIPGALNTGLAVCEGEYLCRVDSDDLLTNDCLEKQMRFLANNPQYNGVICDEIKVDQKLNPRRILVKLPDDYFIKKQNLFRTAYGGPTTIVKTEIFKQCGFDERLRAAPDRAVAIKMHKLTKLGCIPERLYIYREHSQNITKKSAKFKKSNEFKAIFAEYIDKHFVKEDYINHWEMLNAFLKYENLDYFKERKKHYANTILKCALHLAKKYKDKKTALEELAKAQYLYPQNNYWVFKPFILMTEIVNFDKLLQNFNVWSNYAYDDFGLIEV